MNAVSGPTMKTSSASAMQPSLAQCVAGEDLQIGDYIAVLNSTFQLISSQWDRCDRSPEEIIRVKFIPADAGQPRKVVGVCLPFVYVKCANDTSEIIDLRLTQLARLDRQCAKEIWRQTGSKIKIVI